MQKVTNQVSSTVSENRYFIVVNEDGAEGLEHGWVVKTKEEGIRESYILVQEDFVNFGRTFTMLLVDLREITKAQYDALSYYLNEGYNADFMIKVLTTGIETETGDLQHDLIKVIWPEVRNVVESGKDESLLLADVDEATIFMVAVRICEERPDDAFDFYVTLENIAALKDNDDWSDVNSSIFEMIKKVETEKLLC